MAAPAEVVDEAGLLKVGTTGNDVASESALVLELEPAETDDDPELLLLVANVGTVGNEVVAAELELETLELEVALVLVPADEPVLVVAG